MIKLLRKLATAMLPAFLCGTLFIGCEADDKYTKVDDLFQPRFVLEKPEVKANSVTLVWYQVNDAISYTVQLHQDQYYTSLFMEIETTDPYVFIDDIPYGTTFYIRVRSNAANATNNSQWKYTSASTEARPSMPGWWKMYLKPRLRNHPLSFAGRKTTNKIRWIA